MNSMDDRDKSYDKMKARLEAAQVSRNCIRDTADQIKGLQFAARLALAVLRERADAVRPDNDYRSTQERAALHALVVALSA